MKKTLEEILIGISAMAVIGGLSYAASLKPIGTAFKEDCTFLERDLLVQYIEIEQNKQPRLIREFQMNFPEGKGRFCTAIYKVTGAQEKGEKIYLFLTNPSYSEGVPNEQP